MRMEKTTTLSRIWIGLLVSCSNSDPAQYSELPRRVPMNVCTIAQSARYFGRFEVLREVAPGTSAVTVRLVEAVISRPPRDTRQADLALASARALPVGQTLAPTLVVRRTLKAGDSLLLFLMEQASKSRLEDALAQGVFVRNQNGLYENDVRYVGDAALKEAEIMAEAFRASASPDGPNAGQFCVEVVQELARADAGTVETTDGGR